MLVLPEGEKELILALANRDRLMKGIFNDVVQRRGQHYRVSLMDIDLVSN